jgi:signal transduction histidine kinase
VQQGIEHTRSVPYVRQKGMQSMEAEAMNRTVADARSNKATSVVHDLNNCLMRISWSAEMLSEVVADGQGQELLSEILKAVDRAAELARQLSGSTPG